MNSQRRQFLRQGGNFRLRLERLERRDCPSCTVFQKEETLVILGDEGANQIAIADTREGDIVVTCDVGDPHRFTGVNRIDLRTLGGDDEINATFSNPPDPVFEFRAELGTGNDRLTISGFDPQPDPPLRRSSSFDIQTGAGDDEILATFACPADPNFHFRANLGAGDDRLNINWQNPPDPVRLGESNPPEPVRTVDFDIHAGAGDDAIAARFACPSDHYHFRADLGAGDDRLSISGFDPQPDPPLASAEFDIRAGAGDDEIVFDLGGAEINGRFLVSAHGGAGNDRLAFGAIEPCYLPGSETQFALLGGAGDDLIEMSLTGLENEGGRFVLEAAGGIGNDHLVLGAIDPCYLPESETRIALSGDADDDLIEISMRGLESEGRFVLEAAGGGGNDHLIVGVDPCFLPESETRIGLFGNDGDDLIEMSLTGLENEGRLLLEAAGGLGNDHLVLGAVDPCWLPESETRIALLGNAGDDLIEVSMSELEIEGGFDLSILGGVGNDILESFIQPCILPAGRASFLFDGDAGADRIAARFEADADSRGALDVRVLGGLGDDDLTLALFGADDLALLLALVDGGRNHDIARVTRNVRVVNCEEVIFLDEPR
jgi:hypothetical protein